MWKPVIDITGEHSAEFAAVAVEAVAEISGDENASDIFRYRRFEDGDDREAIIEKSLQTSVVSLLKDHKETLYRLFSANQGISVELYKENMTAMTISADISGMVADPAFRAFFGFAQRTRQPLQSAPVNTQGQNDSSRFRTMWRRKFPRKRKRIS